MKGKERNFVLLILAILVGDESEWNCNNKDEDDDVNV